MPSIGDWIQPDDEWIKQNGATGGRYRGAFGYTNETQFASMVNNPGSWTGTSTGEFITSQVDATKPFTEWEWGQTLAATVGVAVADVGNYPQRGPGGFIPNNVEVEFESDDGEYLGDWQAFLVIYSPVMSGMSSGRGIAYGHRIMGYNPTSGYPGLSAIKAGPGTSASPASPGVLTVSLSPGQRIGWFALTASQSAASPPTLDGDRLDFVEGAQSRMEISGWYPPPRYRLITYALGQPSHRQRQNLAGNTGGWPLRQRQNGNASGAWPLRQP